MSLNCLISSATADAFINEYNISFTIPDFLSSLALNFSLFVFSCSSFYYDHFSVSFLDFLILSQLTFYAALFSAIFKTPSWLVCISPYSIFPTMGDTLQVKSPCRQSLMDISQINLTKFSIFVLLNVAVRDQQTQIWLVLDWIRSISNLL